MRPTPTEPIEALEPDLRRAGTVRIVVGGRTVLIAPDEAVHRENLTVGDWLSPEQIGRLEEASDRHAAYRTAIRFLERRPFARRDLARRLVQKGHPPTLVQTALDRAAAAGYLNDARFAEQYVASRSARGRGPARLRRELLQLGVAAELIDRALGSDLTDPGKQAERVSALIAKRRGQLAGLSPAQARRRLMAFLSRRGFSGPHVLALVREAVRSRA